MKPVAKPRMRKSRPAKVRVEKPLAARGWQLPAKWFIVARKGQGEAYQRMTRTASTYEDAKVTRDELIRRGWDSVELKLVENLTRVKK